MVFLIVIPGYKCHSSQYRSSCVIAFESQSGPQLNLRRSFAMAAWWTHNRLTDDDSASRTSAITCGPQNVPLRSLGVICEAQSEYAEYYELEFLHLMREYATDLWPSLSGGHNEDCEGMTKRLYLALEIDEKGIMDLMLLAQSGEVGRAEYNYIMWRLITDVALNTPYMDLNKKISQMVLNARKHFERPPTKNWEDRHGWGWASYLLPGHWEWSPCAVPKEYLDGDEMVLTGDGGMPLEPPHCYSQELRVPLSCYNMEGPEKLDLTRDPRPATEQRQDEPHHAGWRSRSQYGGSKSSTNP